MLKTISSGPIQRGETFLIAFEATEFAATSVAGVLFSGKGKYLPDFTLPSDAEDKARIAQLEADLAAIQYTNAELIQAYGQANTQVHELTGQLQAERQITARQEQEIKRLQQVLAEGVQVKPYSELQFNITKEGLQITVPQLTVEIEKG